MHISTTFSFTYWFLLTTLGNKEWCIINSDNYYYNIVRKNIKKYRKLANLTQQNLADKSGITMNYLAKIESEKMQRCFSIAVIGRIADSLNIDIRNLFDIN